MITAIALLVGSMSVSASGPDRLFSCTLGKVTNMAAATVAELGLVGAHPVILLQPDGAVEYENQPARGPKAVRLVKFADPDHILPTRHVEAIADTWPAKVEVSTILPGKQRMFVTFGSIDPVAGTATGSAGMIDDASETIVADSFYQGNCSIEVAPGLMAKYEALKAAAEKEIAR
jgi:hypothetical protein